ncbi:MAG: S8 family peptidase [Elusimicrobia bacterium]|nr:S8 family peptidase [Elusimicrobiota bacterium]
MSLRNALVVLVLSLVGYVPSIQAANNPSKRQTGSTHIVTFRPEIPAAERRRLVESQGAAVLRELSFIDALVVRMPSLQSKAAAFLAVSPSVEGLEENSYRKWIESSIEPLSSVVLPSIGEVLSAARQGKTAPKVGEANGEIPWGIARVKASAAWKRAMGSGVKVGVIDTGIDCGHPDLASNCAGGYNALDPNADPYDDNGHGTHVAGTIAAAKDGKGVVGVAPKAKLYAIKVLDADGGGTVEGIIAGIGWAADNKMQVVNMSLGGPSSPAMQKAVKKAYAAGVAVVAAAGNDPNSPVSAPASYKESIAVSASTVEDKLAFFSTTGPEVAVIAPGHEIVSCAPGGGTAKHSGTSMAAPHVSGLAALAVSLGASSPKAVRSALLGAAVPIEGLSAEQQGSGLPEADKLGK